LQSDFTDRAESLDEVFTGKISKSVHKTVQGKYGNESVKVSLDLIQYQMEVHESQFDMNIDSAFMKIFKGMEFVFFNIWASECYWKSSIY
jgi:hypothetical protein